MKFEGTATGAAICRHNGFLALVTANDTGYLVDVYEADTGESSAPPARFSGITLGTWIGRRYRLTTRPEIEAAILEIAGGA